MPTKVLTSSSGAPHGGGGATHDTTTKGGGGGDGGVGGAGGVPAPIDLQKQQHLEKVHGGSESKRNSGALPVVMDTIKPGTRVLVFEEGPIDVAKAKAETFMAVVKGSDGMCMVESDQGSLRSVPLDRVVCMPFRELRAKATIDAVRPMLCLARLFGAGAHAVRFVGAQ